MALPGEADVNSDARADIELYLQGKSLTGPERVRLFKLAFDASISGFSGRQSLYEYFFFGDPVRMAGAMVNSYDRGARPGQGPGVCLEPHRLTTREERAAHLGTAKLFPKMCALSHIS